MQVRKTRAAAAVVLLAALALPACTPDTQVDSSGGQPRPATATPSPAASTAPAATPAPTSPTPSRRAANPVEAAILAQYRAYFDVLTPAASAKPDDRREMLANVAADPSLSRTLQGMAAADAFGEVGYGHYVLHPKVSKVAGASAVVSDCQDTSQTGRKKVATGKKVTVGVKNTRVTVGMKRGTDGLWRVSTADYESAGSCTVAA